MTAARIPTQPTIEKRVVSTRANALAERLEEGARALYAFASTLTDEEWMTPISARDGRTVGVIVHHVGSMYPLEIQLAQTIADGKALPGVTMDDVDAINAAHAQQFAGVTRAEALAFLRANSTSAAAALRGITSEQLDRATTAPLYYGAPITCQFMIEDHALRHSYFHLARIRRAVKR
jgi:hypothetical protein